MTMPTDLALDAAADFYRRCAEARDDDGLFLPDWGLEDWRALFLHATTQILDNGEALLRRGESDRALYFVVGGALEVSAAAARGGALGGLFRETPGSVIGEISFFDGRGRSATVWAIQRTQLLRLDFHGFLAFADERPARARELLFALGRVIAWRLRRGEARRDHWPY